MTPADLSRVSRELAEALDAITRTAVEQLTRVVADFAAAAVGPLTGDDAPTTGADEPVGPRCDHTEPDTPCDWDRCTQPERLARGDRGGLPPTPVLDSLRAGQWITADNGSLPLLVAGCDASMLGVNGKPIGPCVLRHDHAGPVHRAADGTTWWPTPDDGSTTATTEQPTADDVAVAAELRSIADAVVADAATYPGAGANWHNGIDHAVRAMQARADWMDHRTDGLTPPAAGLPPAKPCTKHTGADRQRYGCTGPDPQES
ncbi:hypothetical protein [Streptomyces sp. RKAG337]|uniref:hypothetical protein n=1 Tax=Streptomyces sp. RKAG337 TaxID=2893404 RepID=UPI002033D16A|nr:hypothetical protein [Streptomyces sp. RKAG337]MCM2427365.1 hypothetical protein [Streptomyces sp. RKAG337]